MTQASLRTWTVRYVYASVAAHLLVGMLLPLVAGAPLFDRYHDDIGAAFWGGAVPAQSRAVQVWWISLFGPTVQAAAVWMGALAWMGDRQRNAFAWGALIAGIVLWAPQDILISLQAQCWVHVWLDSFAVAAMLPPLIYLFLIDRRQVTP